MAHTHQVLAHLESAQSRLAEAESAQRLYLLTGDDSAQAHFRSLVPQFESEVAQLRSLTRDNASQQRRLGVLEGAAGARLALLKEVAYLRSTHPEEVSTGLARGRAQMAEVHRLLEELRAEEERLLRERLEAAERASWAGLAATTGTGGLALALLLVIHAAATRHAGQLGRAYDKLADEAAKLESRVNARTAELADANATLQGYAHTIAHDLRAPLRNIQGFAAALLEDERERLSPEGIDQARRLSASAGRLDAMIIDLLAYSRIDRQHLSLKPTDLQPVLRQACQDLEQEIRSTRARLEIPTELPTVLAHPATLSHVVANLLGNALKFVAPGQAPHIQVSAREEAGRVALHIADHGIGISPQHQERIFGVFERLHGNERYPGTGIGLAIVRKALERMNGTVRVISTEGQGATFIIELASAPHTAP